MKTAEVWVGAEVPTDPCNKNDSSGAVSLRVLWYITTELLHTSSSIPKKAFLDISLKEAEVPVAFSWVWLGRRSIRTRDSTKSTARNQLRTMWRHPHCKAKDRNLDRPAVSWAVISITIGIPGIIILITTAFGQPGVGQEDIKVIQLL